MECGERVSYARDVYPMHEMCIPCTQDTLLMGRASVKQYDEVDTKIIANIVKENWKI